MGRPAQPTWPLMYGSTITLRLDGNRFRRRDPVYGRLATLGALPTKRDVERTLAKRAYLRLIIVTSRLSPV